MQAAFPFPLPRTGNVRNDDENIFGGSFSRIMGLSFVAGMIQNPYIWDSARLLVLGTLIETGRRLCQWLMERFKFQYCITAQFSEGDPSYEWVVLFLTQENVWRRSRDFRVNEKNSKRKWGLKLGPEIDGNADYVPTYNMAQLFRWKGYWIEIKKGQNRQAAEHQGYSPSMMNISIYTLDMNVLYKFVEEARERYKEVSRPNVTVHMADMPTYGPGFVWSNVKHKARRPISSIILNEGVVDSLIQDAEEFIATEDWYVEAGIPHRRGYLLYGPPGTGKTSTIYALAGELGLEIYALSLSSGFVDDSFLQKAASSIPKNSILLIEDIDCAFPSREDADDDDDDLIAKAKSGNGSFGGSYVGPGFIQPGMGRKSAVTLSGLLNVLDGVGSEEGKLFFATTNYIDRLDPALLRPGRIDMKVQYKFSTTAQASALFLRFFDRPIHSTTSKTTTTLTTTTQTPPTTSSTPDLQEKPSDSSPSPSTPTQAPPSISALAAEFASHIPPHEFSTAELQGFLLSCKTDAARAAATAGKWVANQLGERAQKRAREEEARRRKKERREERERKEVEGVVRRFGGMVVGAGMGVGAEARGEVVVGGMVTGGNTGLVVGPVRTPSPLTPSPAYEDNLKVQGEIVQPQPVLGNRAEDREDVQTPLPPVAVA